MKTITLGKSSLIVPQVAVGCMRIGGMDKKSAETFVKTALDLGANFFDHADIYGGGSCERVFAEAVGMSSSVRENLIIQSKCGIVPGKMFDFSKEHIISSTEKILQRLNTEYLDVLLLHRPDALAEPEEVAEAFDALQSSGKVRNFGMSNQDSSTLELFQRSIKQPLLVNQVQFSITNASLITQGMNMNTYADIGTDRDNGTLNYCRLNNITVQPWSPFQYGFFEGVFIGNEKFPALNAKLDEIAAKYALSNTTIALAWILRHPAKMQPVTGTTNVSRLADCVKATEIVLSREEWYEIYLAAGHRLP